MMVAVATLLRFALAEVIGANLLFVLFYPTILLVAWMAGLAPAVFAVALSALLTKYFFFGLVHPAVLGLPHNANGSMLFTAVGIGISGVTDIYRQRTRKVAEFETAI